MGQEVDDLEKSYELAHDDYRSILTKSLGDRLAEALAELTHKKVREFFGLNENLTSEDLISEKYQGIRPAPGYPACPDHSEKEKIWRTQNIEMCNRQIKYWEYIKSGWVNSPGLMFDASGGAF